MTQLDLSDTALLLSLKVDSAARLENLARFRAFYAAFTTGAEIVIVQQGNTPIPAGDDLSVHVVPDPGLHWKTRNLNLGAAMSSRPFLLITDIDMVPQPAALEMAVEKLRAGAAFSHLFDGLVLNLTARRLERLDDWAGFMRELPRIPRAEVVRGESHAKDGVHVLYGDARHRATGGAFICRREAFFAVGGMNENLVSYGVEDEEFDLRVRRLDYTFEDIEEHNLYHLDHPRGTESRRGPLTLQNKAELSRIAGMERTELAAYAARRFRSITFEPGFVYDRQAGPDHEIWQRRPDLRRDLSHLTILLLADPQRAAPEDTCLDALVAHVDSTYRQADIRVCEAGTNRFKFPANRSQFVHHPLEAPVTAKALRAIRASAGRPQLILARLGRDADAQLETLKSRIARSAAPLQRAPARPLPEGARAIYLRFDDGFRDYACACMASLSQNYPRHPPILVDYSGDDPELHAWIEAIDGVRLPVAQPAQFTRYLTRARARDAVIARFRLWRSDFRGIDTILHLDADTLVLAPLDDLFEHPAPFIVANHEPSPAVRIFDAKHKWSQELHRLLQEDGLGYPGHADDMGNAGLFTLPVAFRSRAHIARLAYLAERYGRFMAYADQSLLSLWLLGEGIRPQLSFRDNFQTPLFTDPHLDVPFESIRVLHFSSALKPGTDAFDEWHRVGPAKSKLKALFAGYRSAPIPRKPA